MKCGEKNDEHIHDHGKQKPPVGSGGDEAQKLSFKEKVIGKCSI